MNQPQPQSARTTSYAIPLIALVPNHRQQGLNSLISNTEFEVMTVNSSAEVSTIVEQHPFSVVLIEASEAGLPASDLCNRIDNAGNAVVVVISSSDFATGRITCWRAGADLVLAPNSSTEEVLWGCRNLSQRMMMRLQAKGLAEYSAESEWFFEQQSFRLIRKDGAWVRLSRNEAQIMAALCNSCNKVVKRNVLWQLLDKADWRYNDRTLDVLIARIRAKMRQVDIDPGVILTHYGAGYELRINT
ncbi:winged helix-turn-helix domain-containing protein [uncultured Ferrimonas sp.]|uniref:winged helix-turn-helix transcriptional regulator n=1 Tax=uncultured Ferrimonas sp. TaxID=432640 RepID=UPI0026292188|nr:winged helix-turn-helix domain-containing protein [uncultured Ferrimonas sp.]